MENVTFENPKPQPPEEIPMEEDPIISSLTGQNSIMSLTLNEIQLKRGKSVGSMNMDEFLANLWNDDNQVQAPMQPNHLTKPATEVGGGMENPRQGSFAVPSPLCKKTVDEVWCEIQKEQPGQQPKSSDSIATDHQLCPDTQLTLGEITLEDFLVKAGVVRGMLPHPQHKMAQPPPPPPQMSANGCNLDVSYGMGHVMGIGYHHPPHQNLGASLSGGNGFVAYQMVQGQSKMYAGESPTHAKTENGHSTTPFGVQSNRKRIIEGPPEVVVERRQRRMIKNRESAARSRARKQAYTVELELELNQLKDENDKLKQFVEEVEHRRKEEVMRRKSSVISHRKADKLNTIRRTVSLAW